MSHDAPHRHLVDVHVLLVREGRVLLTRRRDPDVRFDGRWHLPAGKLEAGESVLAAAAREVAEEVGVVVEPGGLRHVHTTHAVAPGVEARVGLFFEARVWRGEPVVREPEKCSGLAWFAFDDLPLPDDLLEYSAIGLRAVGCGAVGAGTVGSAAVGAGTVGSGAIEPGVPGAGSGATFSVYGWDSESG